jgi:hypothetical protein
MSTQRELKLPSRPDCIKYLEAVSKISESTILNAHEGDPGLITSLVSSADNTLILYSELSGVGVNYNGSINIPDIKKLIRVVDSVDTKDISLLVNSNNIEYKGKSLKFKYHLYEDGFLTKPSINIEKIKSFNYNIKFTLKKETINSIIKGSTFATETNKLYLYTEDGHLKGELTDRARHNTDVFAIDLGEVDFELSPLPLNFDNIKLLSFISDQINFGINTEYGVTVIDISNDNIKLKYIITSLTQ